MSQLSIGVFAKPPIEGNVKTRLAKAIGSIRATDVYRQCLRKLQWISEFDAVIYSATAENLNLLEEIFEGLPIRIQEEGDLGFRMANAIHELSAAGSDVLIIGSDIPGITRSVIVGFTEALRGLSCAIGYTTDGGYYGISFQHEIARDLPRLLRIFSSIDWSTEKVFRQQTSNLDKEDILYEMIEPLDDLDEFPDLLRESKKDPSWRLFLPDIRIILPVLNEEDTLPQVIQSLRQIGIFKEIIIADNGSTDNSRSLAESHNCRVSLCIEKGYGATLLSAIQEIPESCEILTFIDADGSDDESSLLLLITEILMNHADLVIGRRFATGRGSFTPAQNFGNWLARILLRLLYRMQIGDLGPMRAIRFSTYKSLKMNDRNFGWTIQMQIRAHLYGFRTKEIPVPYSPRKGGVSKISGNIIASLKAGKVILTTIFREFYQYHRSKEKGGRRV